MNENKELYGRYTLNPEVNNTRQAKESIKYFHKETKRLVRLLSLFEAYLKNLSGEFEKPVYSPEGCNDPDNIRAQNVRLHNEERQRKILNEFLKKYTTLRDALLGELNAEMPDELSSVTVAEILEDFEESFSRDMYVPGDFHRVYGEDSEDCYDCAPDCDCDGDCVRCQCKDYDDCESWASHCLEAEGFPFPFPMMPEIHIHIHTKD